MLGHSWAQKTHLSQVTLNKSKEGLVFSTAKAAAAYVKKFKTKTLPLLKIKVQGKDLGEVGVPTAGDHFSAVHLQSKSNRDLELVAGSDFWVITP